MNFPLNRLLSTGALTMTLLTSVAGTQVADSHLKNAPTPPMGWNSWDYFGTTLNEAQAKSQADAMARQLKPAGGTCFTVDIQWYEPVGEGSRVRRGCAAGDGRVQPPAAGAAEVPVRRRRCGVQAAGRLRPRQGPEVRHPHHARHPAAGGEAEHADQGHRPSVPPTSR